MKNTNKPSIVDYLLQRGVAVTQVGQRWEAPSPIKFHLYGEVDRTPSFVVFPDLKFKDFSTGHSGDVYDLQRILGDSTDLSSLPTLKPKIKQPQSHWENTIPPHHLTISPEEESLIREYGRRRKITSGFIPSTYLENTHHLALMFPHLDLNGSICGAKFRSLNPSGRRFTLRGRTGFYTLVSGSGGDRMVLIESETSANSLWEIYKKLGVNATIRSHGSVEIIPKELPEYEGEGYLLLDYDGNEQKFNQRVEKYSHLKLKTIKLNLPKGEDVNSLLVKNQDHLIWGSLR